jgi:hypothetical protein
LINKDNKEGETINSIYKINFFRWERLRFVNIHVYFFLMVALKRAGVFAYTTLKVHTTQG